jgi:citrate lyase subunit beta/citryl-CoA lyase
MSVYPDVADTDGLAESCRAGRALGFVGRAAIHPRQLPVIVAAFLPTADEVSRARAVLDALAEAQAAARGTAVLPDGRFVDRAMRAAAQRIIDLAARSAVVACREGEPGRPS